MALTFDLNNMFIEVLNPSYIYQITSKVHFVKRLANYIKYVPNIGYHNSLVMANQEDLVETQMVNKANKVTNDV